MLIKKREYIMKLVQEHTNRSFASSRFWRQDPECSLLEGGPLLEVSHTDVAISLSELQHWDQY